MYPTIRKPELRLHKTVSIWTAEFGMTEFFVLTNEFSRLHGTYKYATQISCRNEINQRLNAGFVRYYNTEEEARQGHNEIIRKLKNGEFQLIPEKYNLVMQW